MRLKRLKMRAIVVFVVFVSITRLGYGQITPSSCIAPDSIVSKYSDDADKLALRRIYENNLTYVDSVEIPQEYSDSLLNALIAIYNAVELPERDSVISIYDIHLANPDLNFISIDADSNLTWMQNLQDSIIPTGNKHLDSLLVFYDFSLWKYYKFNYHRALFKSKRNYNTKVLANDFDKIPNVIDADIVEWIGVSKDITSKTYPDYIELIFRYGWMDCPMGCVWNRYWKFHVYYDCSVEFIESYGSPITPVGISNDFKKSSAVYPNPFKNILKIKGDIQDYDYSIYNITGQKVLHGQTADNRILNLNLLSPGQYILVLKSNKSISTFKILKE